MVQKKSEKLPSNESRLKPIRATSAWKWMMRSSPRQFFNLGFEIEKCTFKAINSLNFRSSMCICWKRRAPPWNASNRATRINWKLSGIDSNPESNYVLCYTYYGSRHSGRVINRGGSTFGRDWFWKFKRSPMGSWIVAVVAVGVWSESFFRKGHYNVNHLVDVFIDWWCSAKISCFESNFIYL